MRGAVGVVVFFLAGCRPSVDAGPRASRVGDEPTTREARTCGDVVGRWSPVVSGLRARVSTSGSKLDKSELHVVLEIENVADSGPIEIHWNGYIPHGFVALRLDDAKGVDIEPAWKLPGNAPSGEARAIFPPKTIVSYELHRGAFATMMGKRVLRIGAFWGRELPADGSPRFLRVTLTGGPSVAGAAAYQGFEANTSAPAGRAWIGKLEVPAVCIE